MTLCNKETKKQRNKEIERAQYPKKVKFGLSQMTRNSKVGPGGDPSGLPKGRSPPPSLSLFLFLLFRPLQPVSLDSQLSLLLLLLICSHTFFPSRTCLICTLYRRLLLQSRRDSTRILPLRHTPRNVGHSSLLDFHLRSSPLVASFLR